MATQRHEKLGSIDLAGVSTGEGPVTTADVVRRHDGGGIGLVLWDGDAPRGQLWFRHPAALRNFGRAVVGLFGSGAVEGDSPDWQEDGP